MSRLSAIHLLTALSLGACDQLGQAPGESGLVDRQPEDGIDDAAKVGPTDVAAIDDPMLDWFRGDGDAPIDWVGASGPSATRLLVGEAPKVKGLVAGFGHNCAIVSAGPHAGELYCWGFNAWADLGDRTQLHRPYPVQAQGLVGIKAVAAGAGHTCALNDAGDVLCWGDYRDGQTGNCAESEGDLPEPQRVPGRVIGLPAGEVTAIAAGEEHTCALVDGGVMCWGDNLFAQLGTGHQGGARAWADWVPGIGRDSGVIAIGAGFYHTCAAFEGGGAKCWGNNYACQLGQDGICNMGGRGPGWVTGLPMSSEVVQIAGGGLHNCMLLADGRAFCWGASSSGQVGGGTRGLETQPVQVIGMGSGVTALAAGESTTCAVKGGGAWCWGSNTWGKLGVGEGTIPAGCTEDPSWPGVVGLCTVPAQVSGLTSGVSRVAVGFDHACALKNGGVSCWGNGGYGSVGNNRFDNYVPEPVPVVWAGFPGPGGTLPPVIVPDHCE